MLRATGTFWILFSCQVAFAQHDNDSSRTITRDVVELIAGNSIAGESLHASTSKGITYLFSSAENKARFDADPTRYSAQMDGRCSRMGSLSSDGRSDLNTVYEGKFYLFASEGCLAAFIKNPEKSLEQDDSIPKFTREQQKKGSEILDQVVTAMGGEQRFSELQNIKQSYEENKTVEGRDYKHKRVWLVDFNGHFWEADTWNDRTNVKYLSPTESKLIRNGHSSAMFASAQREMRRHRSRELLVILKARGRDDFQVGRVEDESSADGQDDGKAVVTLVVSFQDCVSRLSIDPKSQLVQAIEYRGRGPKQYFGKLRLELDHYLPVDGLLLPHRQSTKFEGERVPSSSRELSISTNLPEIDPANVLPASPR